MKSFFRAYFLLFVGLFFLVATSYADTFEMGKHYEEIAKTDTMLFPKNSSKLTVVEFFSYGCPWCYRFEPSLETWLAQNQKQVSFSRIPVIFEQGWETYAKAYYIVQALKLEQTITMPLFDAVQQKQINSDEDLKKFFLKHGVKEKTYDSIANSPVIDNDMKQAGQAMTDFRIEYVPTIIIAGKYKTHIGMVDGDNDRFIALLNFLVKKASNEKVQ